MVTSRVQNAGQNHNIKTDNTAFEGWTVCIIGNNLNESTLYSGRN